MPERPKHLRVVGGESPEAKEVPLNALSSLATHLARLLERGNRPDDLEAQLELVRGRREAVHNGIHEAGESRRALEDRFEELRRQGLVNQGVSLEDALNAALERDDPPERIRELRERYEKLLRESGIAQVHEEQQAVQKRIDAWTAGMDAMRRELLGAYGRAGCVGNEEDPRCKDMARLCAAAGIVFLPQREDPRSDEKQGG